MPRYLAKLDLPNARTNGERYHAFIDHMKKYNGLDVTIVSCPKYYFKGGKTQFKFECDHPNLASMLDDTHVYDIVRLWDETDTGKAFYG